jgi:hypothetical protein
MVIILPNPQKACPMDYMIGKEKTTSEAFVGFLTYLIANPFVMDNVMIHIHGNSRVIEDMLWETSTTLSRPWLQ